MLCWFYGTKDLSRRIDTVDVQVLPIIFPLGGIRAGRDSADDVRRIGRAR